MNSAEDAASCRGDLPRYANRFVGRASELATVRRLLAPGRLVTLVAVGGAGKTRLAAELVRNSPAVWVELAVVQDRAAIGAAVAAALGLPSGSGGSIESLAAALANPGPVMVLDNAEHVAEACGEFVGRLLDAAASLRVLATSRIPLESPREWVYVLPPLAESAELSIAAATRAADGHSDVANCRFEVATADTFSGASLDLVTTFDCLHDLGDPVAAARYVRRALADDGCWLIVEPAAGDMVSDNLNPVGRIYYNASTLMCVPNALSQSGAVALGAQAGPAAIERVCREAGFTRFRQAAATPFNLVYDVRP